MNKFEQTLLDARLSKQEWPGSKRWISHVLRYVKHGHHDLYFDLKNTRLLRGLRWFSVFLWVAGLMVCVVIVSMGNIVPEDKACLPDGSFRVNPGSYSPWASSSLFQITLGGGQLTFAQVKAVDITWDIVRFESSVFRS